MKKKARCIDWIKTFQVVESASVLALRKHRSKYSKEVGVKNTGEEFLEMISHASLCKTDQAGK